VKLRWRCHAGHEWDAAPAQVKHSSWCPIGAKRYPGSIDGTTYRDGVAASCPDGATGAGLCLEVPDETATIGDGSVCSTSACDDVADCPAAPPTGDAVLTCLDLTGDGQGNCFLECAGGQTCPDATACHPIYDLCYWPDP
jgi:hypothetical protein